MTDSNPTSSVPEGVYPEVSPEFEFIELLAPIADASRLLARAIKQTAGNLAGASIAVTDRDTLLLNPAAWQLFAEVLRTLPDLKIKSIRGTDARPLRFLLLASPLPPSKPAL